jgi:tripartite-type tricarboxylate transporter receptor subunit TctC
VTISRRSALLSLTAAAISGMARPAIAQGYPSKPIRIIVPYAPGNGLDVNARIFAALFSEKHKANIFVENRDGAGGLIGTVAAAKSPSDGYTLLFCSAALTYTHLLQEEVTYDPVKDFKAIIGCGVNPLVLVTAMDAPYKTFKELIAYMKANPGRTNYATSGKGTASHLETSLLAKRFALNSVDVSYKTFAAAVTDTISGRVGFFLSSPPGLMPHIKAGSVRPLAMGTLTRSPHMPDVPTFAEELGAPDYVVDVWNGFVAPAGTPDDVIAAFHDKAKAVLEMPEFREKIEASSSQVVIRAPAPFGELIRKDTMKWTEVMESLGLKALKS